MSILGKLFSGSKEDPSVWIKLEDDSNLEDLVEKSKSKPVLILKHSTRCSISSMAKNRLERDWNLIENKVFPYMVLVVEQRVVSNTIANKFGIEHESPQAIILKNGISIYNASHGEISIESINAAIKP